MNWRILVELIALSKVISVYTPVRFFIRILIFFFPKFLTAFSYGVNDRFHFWFGLLVDSLIKLRARLSHGLGLRLCLLDFDVKLEFDVISLEFFQYLFWALFIESFHILPPIVSDNLRFVGSWSLFALLFIFFSIWYSLKYNNRV